MNDNHPHPVTRFRKEAELLIAAAKASGVVVSIDLEPSIPLAMGKYRMVVHARPARHAPTDAIEIPEPQPTDKISRWLFDAVKSNLDALHALCLEFGCHQGDTVVDWLRARLTAQPPAGYCIQHADGLRWRTLDSMGAPDWTVDEAEALCFSLRHHADAFAGDDPEDVRIVPRARGY
ncbi:hypothetical protein [Paraburkholderia elongata]|uniref:Uncharacterized protein n=1 Tax=Paraburkholderia elongata TaxID=2675747 RepID=A0A972SM14_9BURK|nr:hypothetical protein [Paraburkholderia elongata]NPT59697.1 hypothetical protein [Paraburkholderia elongata]